MQNKFEPQNEYTDFGPAGPIDFVAPYVIFASPARGCEVMLGQFKLGADVCVIVAPGLLPVQYREMVAAHATLVEQDIYTDEGFNKAADISRARFGAFYFLGSYETDDRQIDAEYMLLEMNLRHELMVSRRVIWLPSTSQEVLTDK